MWKIGISYRLLREATNLYPNLSTLSSTIDHICILYPIFFLQFKVCNYSNIFIISVINSMLKFTRFSPSLTKTIKYNFLPPSCYDIQLKPNPVICVTLGNNDGPFCDLHFRVHKNIDLVILECCSKNSLKL